MNAVADEMSNAASFWRRNVLWLVLLVGLLAIGLWVGSIASRVQFLEDEVFQSEDVAP